MRYSNLLLVVCLGGTLASCAVTRMELARPYAIARIDSSKAPGDFANCVSRALGAPVRNESGSTVIFIHNKTNIRIARWDFLATAAGSQAELRAGSNYDPRLDDIRACA